MEKDESQTPLGMEHTFECWFTRARERVMLTSLSKLGHVKNKLAPLQRLRELSSSKTGKTQLRQRHRWSPE